MSQLTPIQHIEYLHLVFLRLLESRMDRRSWVVKGGVNLRAWFGSLRYSEDLDIDVIRGTVFQLSEKIDKLLSAPALRDLLRLHGLAVTRTSKPKQTETTQRWKIEVRSQAAPTPFHTRVEFSRRGSKDEYVLEAVRPEIVRPYGLLAPAANHYTASSAVRQKIRALSDRAETQARDVWDLEHLLRTTNADPRPLTPELRKALARAVDRVDSLRHDVFKAQVVPYLAPDHQELYGMPEVWDRIRDLVVERLLEFSE